MTTDLIKTLEGVRVMRTKNLTAREKRIVKEAFCWGHIARGDGKYWKDMEKTILYYYCAQAANQTRKKGRGK